MEEPLTSTAKKPRLDTSLDVTEVEHCTSLIFHECVHPQTFPQELWWSQEDTDYPTEQGETNAVFGEGSTV